ARRRPFIEGVEACRGVQGDLGDGAGNLKIDHRVLWLLGVVVDRDLPGRRPGLAGEHVPALELVGFERVVLPHLYRALDEPGPAGAADPARAGERHVRAHPQGSVEHGLVRAPGALHRPARAIEAEIDRYGRLA